MIDVQVGTDKRRNNKWIHDSRHATIEDAREYAIAESRGSQFRFAVCQNGSREEYRNGRRIANND